MPGAVGPRYSAVLLGKWVGDWTIWPRSLYSLPKDRNSSSVKKETGVDVPIPPLS